jgi:hypothetical protein
MKLPANPFIRESLADSFSQPQILRTYLLYLVILSCLTFFWWPRGPISEFMRSGEVPQTVTATAIGLIVCLAYMNARFGSEDYAGPESTGVRDFVTLTPVAVSTLVLGRLAAAFLHVLLLLALSVPLFLASRGVCGATYAELGLVWLVAGSSALALRSLAFFLFAVFNDMRGIKNTILAGFGGLWIFATMLFIPAVSPLSAILSLRTVGAAPRDPVLLLGTTIPFWSVSVIISFLAVLAFSAATIVWLGMLRRRYGARPSLSAGVSVPRDSSTSKVEETRENHDVDTTGDLSP